MSTYLTSDTSSIICLLSLPQKHIKTSIGGAGNFRKSSTLLSAPIPCPPRLTPSQIPRVFHTGIGGIGNRHEYSYEDRPVVTREERARRESAAWHQRSGHYGIGGAGNRMVSYDGGSRSSSVSSVGDGNVGVRSGADWMKEMVVGYFGRK